MGFFLLVYWNIWKWIIRGNLVVRRQSLLPRVLSVTEGAAVCRKPFKPPCSYGYSNGKETLTRRLWARKRFVPWGSSTPALVAIAKPLGIARPESDEADIVEENVILPPGVEPLVLWQPEQFKDGPIEVVPIAVDPLLVRFLRPHQRYYSSIISLNPAVRFGICRVELYLHSCICFYM